MGFAIFGFVCAIGVCVYIYRENYIRFLAELIGAVVVTEEDYVALVAEVEKTNLKSSKDVFEQLGFSVKVFRTEAKIDIEGAVPNASEYGFEFSYGNRNWGCEFRPTFDDHVVDAKKHIAAMFNGHAKKYEVVNG